MNESIGNPAKDKRAPQCPRPNNPGYGSVALQGELYSVPAGRATTLAVLDLAHLNISPIRLCIQQPARTADACALCPLITSYDTHGKDRLNMYSAMCGVFGDYGESACRRGMS